MLHICAKNFIQLGQLLARTFSGKVSQLFLSAFLCLLLFTSTSFAAVNGPQTITVDGRLFTSLTSDTALIDPSVVINVKIYNPAINCVLYEEKQTVDTTQSDGRFTINVGSVTGAAKRVSGEPGNTMTAVFQNKSPIAGSCGSYTPAAGDVRYIRIMIAPSTTGTVEVLSPDTIVDTVPNALVAESLQGFGPTNFVQTDSTQLTQTNVANIFSATNYPLLTALLGGTSTSYVGSSTNGAKIPTVAGVPSSLAQGQIWFNSSANAFQYYNGSAVQTLGVSGSGISALTVGSSLTAGGVAGGTLNTSGTIDLVNSGVSAGTYPKVTVNSKGLVTYGTGLAESDIPTLQTAGHVIGDAIVSGTIGGSTAFYSSGNVTTTGTVQGANVTSTYVTSTYDRTRKLSIYGTGGSYSVSLSSPTMGADYNVVFPALQGGAGTSLVNDGSGNLSWVAGSSGSVSSVGLALPSIFTVTNPIVTSTGNLTATLASQNANFIFAGPSSGGAAAPTFRGLAVADLPAGYDASVMKTALGSGQIWIGNSSGIATAVTPFGDVNLSIAGSATVAQIRGVPVSTTLPMTAGQVLRFDGANWTPNFVAMTDLRSKITGATFFSSACGSNQTLTFNSATDSMSCSLIAVASTQVAWGSTGANLVFAGPSTGGAASPTFRTLTAADLPAGTVSQWSTVATTINYIAGFVGVGTTTPQAQLDVFGIGAASAMLVPRDTTGARPTGINGMLRYNTSLAQLETFSSGAWNGVATAAAVGGSYLPLSGGTLTGAVAYPFGSAAAPSINFGDATSGIYSSGSGNVSIGATSGQRMSVSSGGVGIGTATPSATLHVQNASSGILVTRGNDPLAPVAAPYLSAAGTSGFSSTLPVYSFWYQPTTGITNPANSVMAIEAAGNEAMRFDSTGFVGVGTTTPVTTLDVYRNFQADTAVASALNVYSYSHSNKAFTTSLAAANFTTYNGQSNNAPLVTSIVGTTNNDNIATTVDGGTFYGNSTVTFPSFINGISATSNFSHGGTTGNVTGGRFIASVSDGSSVAGTGIGVYSKVTSSGTINTGYGLYLDSVAGTSKYGVYENTGGVNYFAGRVGIGTTAPAAILDVNGSGTTSAMLVPRDSTAARPTGVNGMIRYNTTSNAVESFANGAWSTLATGGGVSSQWVSNASAIYYSSGNVGIGTNNPGTALAVVGDATISGKFAVGGGNTSGSRGIALGAGAVASGPDSVALQNGTAYAQLSFAAGYNTQANGTQSVALGEYAIAGGKDSLATGNTTAAGGDYSSAFGVHTSAPSYAEVVLGSYSVTTGTENATAWVPGDPLFVIGNGVVGTPSTAFTLLKNGRLGIGTASPGAILDIYGVGTGLSAMIVPRDTQANRPSGVNGMIRYNTSVGQLETYSSGAWNGVATSAMGGGSSQWITSGTTISYGTGTGNVGIGMANPTRKLAVVGLGETGAPADGGSKAASILVGSGYGAADDGGSVEFGAGVGTYTQPYFAAIKGQIQNTGGNTVGDLVFYNRTTTGATTLTENMRIVGGTNRVGIGTSNPGAKLDVNGDVTSNRLLSKGTDGANYPNYAFNVGGAGNSMGMFYVANNVLGFSTNLVERLRIDASGNVGINNTAPSAPLDVVGTVRGQASVAALQAYTTGTSQTSISLVRAGAAADAKTWEQIAYNNGDYAIRAVNDAYSAATEGIHMTRGSGAAVSSVYFPAGNIGIGTTIPNYPLHVYSSTNSVSRALFKNASSGSSAYSVVDLGNDQSDFDGEIVLNSSANTGYGGARSMNFLANNGNMTFNTAGTERLRLTSSGVGIGTVPGFPLDVNGTVRVGSNALTAVNGVALTVIHVGGGSQYGIEVRPTTAGGTTPLIFTNSAGSVQGSISNNGTGTTNFNTTSDHRLKENVVPLTNAIDRLSNLEPKRFDYIADPEHRMMDGFIAHEVQVVIPEAVTGKKDAVDEDGKPVYQQLDLSKIVPLVTAAVRELAHRLFTVEATLASKADQADVNAKTAKLEAANAKLEAENAKLNQDNEAMKARLDKIEKMLAK